ncbi:MAG: LD-carboxypeptidase [Desulfobulbaceae bacterium]|nr:LD-carboxypeptidase [Desulfobulbaceae bacterium]
MLFPPPLRPGDTIGIFSPAGPVRDPKKVDKSLCLLREAGFEVVTGTRTGCDVEYLAASDEQRAAELTELWNDPTIHALIAVRGGYGCLRMMDRLDWNLAARHPKLLIGFSDLTALLNTLYARSGLISVHGPVLSTLSTSSEQTRRHFLALLSGEIPIYELGRQINIQRPGKAQGPVLGGNLTTLVHLLATPWDFSWDGAILVLEDTGEELYRIDRMLTQLQLAGKFERLNGLILGDFDRAGRGNPVSDRELALAVSRRVLELTTHLDFPIWQSFPVGHGADNLPFFIGMNGFMDSSNIIFGYNKA